MNIVKEYRNDRGELHREDGPALILDDGSEYWYINGEFHRINGPAVIRFDGTKEWYQNDVRHRIGGPAVIWSTVPKLGTKTENSIVMTALH